MNLGEALDRVNQNAWNSGDAKRRFINASGWTDPGEQAAVEWVQRECRDQPILDIGVGAGRTVPLLRAVSHDYIGVDYTQRTTRPVPRQSSGCGPALDGRTRPVGVAVRSLCAGAVQLQRDRLRRLRRPAAHHERDGTRHAPGRFHPVLVAQPWRTGLPRAVQPDPAAVHVQSGEVRLAHGAAAVPPAGGGLQLPASCPSCAGTTTVIRSRRRRRTTSASSSSIRRSIRKGSISRSSV